MLCSNCGGQVDDPFWDDLCSECEHGLLHDPDENFEPACLFCAGDAESASAEDDHYMAEVAFQRQRLEDCPRG